MFPCHNADIPSKGMDEKSSSCCKTVEELALPNGLTVVVSDCSKRYFGDYHRVTLEIICNVPSPDGAQPFVYRKSLEKMGVKTDDLDAVKKEMLVSFRSTAVPYLSADDFPQKFAKIEGSRKKKRLPLFVEGERE